MNELKRLVIVSALMVSGVNAAGAAETYNVAGVLTEPVAAAGDTTFHLAFTWDSGSQSILSMNGTMNSSMYSAVEDIILDGLVTQSIYSENGNDWVVATVYKNDSSSIFLPVQEGETQIGAFVFSDGSHKDVSKQVDRAITQNAFATFAFDPANPLNTNMWLMSYGDCTVYGMMGDVCMTGHAGPGHTGGGALDYPALGTMAAYPGSISVTSVPLPGAVWLFGSAMVGALGVSRRQRKGSM